MPTYEYQCNDCGRVFEVRQRITEAALTRCDTCGGTLKRLLSAAPFILKGAGWYVTDYPSESRKKAQESEKSGSESAGKKESSAAADKKESSAADKKESSAAEKSSPSTSPTASTSAAAPAPAPSKPSSGD